MGFSGWPKFWKTRFPRKSRKSEPKWVRKLAKVENLDLEKNPKDAKTQAKRRVFGIAGILENQLSTKIAENRNPKWVRKSANIENCDLNNKSKRHQNSGKTGVLSGKQEPRENKKLKILSK